MHTVFVQLNEAAHVIKYCAGVYYSMEKESLGSQSVVGVRTFSDVLKLIETDQNKTFDDIYDIIGIVPTAAELEVLNTIVEEAGVNLILGNNQITPEIENSDVLVEDHNCGLLERVWSFYIVGDPPSFITEMDEALVSKEGSMLEILTRIATMKKKDTVGIIEAAVESNGESLKAL